MTRLCDLLEIPRGVTAVVGGGGKTSLINRLARELSESARVLRMTTTRIHPPDGPVLYTPTPQALQTAFERKRLITACTALDGGKLGPPEGPLLELAALADYTLIEADGSRGLPVKAPAAREPVLTGGEALVVAVAGMEAAGRPIAGAAHRPERYAALVGKPVNALIEPGDIVRALISTHGQRKGVTGRFAVALNQCDTPERLAAGRACAALLPGLSALVALKSAPDFCECWRNGTCLF